MKGTNLFKKNILNSHSNLNLVNNNLKYKLSPVVKYSKFSPQSDYVKNNIEAEEQIDDFVLCEDDDNKNNDENKNLEFFSSNELLRFSLPESSKKIKLMDKSNNNSNNNINNSPKVKQNTNTEMFDNNNNNSLPKLSIQIEDYVYKYDKNEYDLKRYYCCIKGYDLFFFSSNLKNDYVNLLKFVLLEPNFKRIEYE